MCEVCSCVECADVCCVLMCVLCNNTVCIHMFGVCLCVKCTVCSPHRHVWSPIQPLHPLHKQSVLGSGHDDLHWIW